MMLTGAGRLDHTVLLIGLGFAASDIRERDYGRTEFFLTDDDGYSHCFGVPAKG